MPPRRVLSHVELNFVLIDTVLVEAMAGGQPRAPLRDAELHHRRVAGLLLEVALDVGPGQLHFGQVGLRLRLDHEQVVVLQRNVRGWGCLVAERTLCICLVGLCWGISVVCWGRDCEAVEAPRRFQMVVGDAVEKPSDEAWVLVPLVEIDDVVGCDQQMVLEDREMRELLEVLVVAHQVQVRVADIKLQLHDKLLRGGLRCARDIQRVAQGNDLMVHHRCGHSRPALLFHLRQLDGECMLEVVLLRDGCGAVVVAVDFDPPMRGQHVQLVLAVGDIRSVVQRQGFLGDHGEGLQFLQQSQVVLVVYAVDASALVPTRPDVHPLRVYQLVVAIEQALRVPVDGGADPVVSIRKLIHSLHLGQHAVHIHPQDLVATKHEKIVLVRAQRLPVVQTFVLLAEAAAWVLPRQDPAELYALDVFYLLVEGRVFISGQSLSIHSIHYSMFLGIHVGLPRSGLIHVRELAELLQVYGACMRVAPRHFCVRDRSQQR